MLRHSQFICGESLVEVSCGCVEWSEVVEKNKKWNWWRSELQNENKRIQGTLIDLILLVYHRIITSWGSCCEGMCLNWEATTCNCCIDQRSVAYSGRHVRRYPFTWYQNILRISWEIFNFPTEDISHPYLPWSWDFQNSSNITWSSICSFFDFECTASLISLLLMNIQGK